METILVTGGAGFIGSHVCEQLLKLGYKVICVDNFDKYYSQEIKKNNIRNFLENKNFYFHENNICNFNDLEKVFSENKINKVIHLAAKVGVRSSINNPSIYEKINVKGTLNLLELSSRFKIKNFIFTSSSSVYGVNKTPFSEKDKTRKIISPYGLTKRTGEILCKLYSELYNLDVICLRLFTVYGPRCRPDMAIYKFTKLILEGNEVLIYGDGDIKRDYTNIKDVVNGILSALNKKFRFEIINIGNSNPIKLQRIISLIEKNLNKKSKLKLLPKQEGDVPITHADISKAKRLLGYEPKVNIEIGIKKIVDYFITKDIKKKDIHKIEL